MPASFDVVICGAGIAGVSAAYYLSVFHGVKNILLVDERPPLSLTSDKSTEAYRNWWPGPDNAMVAFMNHSIDLLERLADQTNNLIHLNRRGYLYLTADSRSVPGIEATARIISGFGAGDLRVHRGNVGDPIYSAGTNDDYFDQPGGADLLLNPTLIHSHFPYLSEKTVAALHVRRAGWFSGQQLGAYWLAQAKLAGAHLLVGSVTGIEIKNGRVHGVLVSEINTTGRTMRVATSCFINAAGPFQRSVGELLGIDIPVYNELHLKLAFRDSLRAIDRNAPLLIWNDPQYLEWSPDEREFLADDPKSRWMLTEMPGGAHTRPEGGQESPVALMLWDYHNAPVDLTWPIPVDDQYPEIVLRGLFPMLPALRAYQNKMPRPQVDGGYYTKTIENRPLICPLPVTGAYLIGALSGFGMMAASAAGDLIAAYISGSDLPAYAPSFSLERYNDPNYLRALEAWKDTGQL
jgi:glycine/D-amino acid oxidase-like deaminating enzyme